MTQWHVLIEDEDELRDLSFGHTSPRFREMCKTLLDWHLADEANAAKPVEKPPRKKRRTAAA